MVVLSAYKLANYLVDIVQFSSNDVKWESVVLNKLSFIKQKATRNRCFISIDSEKGIHSYFFKQPYIFSPYNVYDFRGESELYRLAKNEKIPNISKILPEWIWFDIYNTVLITKYYPKAKPLDAFNANIYLKAGTVLADFHQSVELKELKVNDSRIKFRNHKPSILNYGVDDLKILKSRGLLFYKFVSFIANLINGTSKKETPLFAQISEDWDKNTLGLIHGDSKSNNFIAFIENGEYVIKILDFEFVCFGNWQWDLSIFIASLLERSTLPNNDNNGGTSIIETVQYIRNFLKGYLEKRIYDDDKKDELQRRLLLLAGVYFLQRFIYTEKKIDLDNGISLIASNELCYEVIFKH